MTALIRGQGQATTRSIAIDETVTPAQKPYTGYYRRLHARRQPCRRKKSRRRCRVAVNNDGFTGSDLGFGRFLRRTRIDRQRVQSFAE